MRTLLFITLSIFSTTAFSQEKFRLSKKEIQEIGKINSDIVKNAVIVERMLDTGNTPPISTIEQAIKNTKAKEKTLQNIRNIVCIKCYEDEWNLIKKAKAVATQKEEHRNDSLKAVERSEIIAERERKAKEKQIQAIAYEKYQDSVRNSPSNENPYDLLKRSLYAFTKNKSFTVFRNMDYNFAGGNIQWYMQYDMRMGMSKDYIMTKTKIVEKYVPKATSKNEFVTITYNVTYHTDLVGYYPTDEVFLINSVVFNGASDYILDLFLNYWPGKLSLGGYKTGLIATKQVLGDLVSLIGEGGKYKITITKGNMDPNYKNTWGINKNR